MMKNVNAPVFNWVYFPAFSGGSEFLFWRRKFLFLHWSFFFVFLIILECSVTSYYRYFLHSKFCTNSPTYSPGQTAIEASSDANVPKTSYLGTNSQIDQRCISAISNCIKVSAFFNTVWLLLICTCVRTWGSFINTPFLKLLTDRVKVCVFLCVYTA